MKKITVRQLAFAGILAAVYAVVTILSAPIAYGAIQFRLSEALTVLCCFTPTAVWGMVLGCLIANLFSPVSVLDVVLGTGATLIACLLTRPIKKPWLVPIPTIAANALIVGAEIAFFTSDSAFLPAFGLNALTVGLGEAVVMYLLGVPLFLYLRRSRAGQRLSSF
ncbi:MAG: QueT transporter family protein [Candidatus Faecousia sp.]|nr:QueT transporter family protein [Candidatus Faecousia sp.]